MDDEFPQLSIIVLVYNEAESLRILQAEIAQSCHTLGRSYEVIFVDDGSRDGSWDVIRDLCARAERVSGIRFRRNFGKAAALTAGMQLARGEFVMTMDADLQDDPAEVPRFLDKLAEGYDVVNGWKVRRLDPWHKVYPSRVFNWLVSRLTGLKLHDHNCGLKCFRAEVAREIRLYGELHRFVPVLAHARGFRVTELDVHHRPRQFGHSKYGFRRFTRGFLDLLTVKFLTGFGQRPQHLLGTCGLGCFAVGFAGLGYLALLWLLTNAVQPALGAWGVADLNLDFGPIGHRPMLIYSAAALLLGAQMLSLGFLAELIVANTGRQSDTFSIVETLGGGGSPAATTPLSPAGPKAPRETAA